MKHLTVINKFRVARPYASSMPKQDMVVPCWAPFMALHITKKGHSRPCPFWDTNGTIHRPKWSKKSSIKKVWNDENGYLEEIRQDMLNGNLHRLCVECIESCNQGKPPSSLDFDWVGGYGKDYRDINYETPKELELELSNTCNYKCKFCSPWCSSQHMEELGLTNQKNLMSIFDDPENREKFIEDLREIIHDLHRINFTGGEPFAQRVVYDILKMINEENPENLYLHFTTNGSIMNGATKKIASRKNVQVTVSLDSINPDTYPILRVNGNLENVLKNIDTYIELGADVSCSFVVSKYNVEELPEIVNWCTKKEILFTYHIMEKMWDDPEHVEFMKNNKIEYADKAYIDKIKKYLLRAKPYLKRNDNNKEGTNKNLNMYKQYIERLK